MKHSEKHPHQNKLSCTPEDLRWATPEIVATYRAKRLAHHGKIIADIGCGIGFQTFAFAKSFAKVYAIDINKQKLECAKANAKILKIENIEFIHGDALNQKVAKQLSDVKVDIIFCDPERLPTEEERTLDTITPNLHQLLRLYSPITKKIAIELPPQIKKIDFEGEKVNGEKEYLSVDGKLNRLTLYLGELTKTERSAVIFPAEARLEADKKAKLTFKKELGKYLYEADPAVAKAELVAELSRITRMSVFSMEKNVFLSSGREVKSSFFSHAFLVLEKVPFAEKDIITALKKAEAEKVTLRFPVNPKEYWKIRTRYEKLLSGSRKVCLFKFGNEAVVAKELNR